MLTVSTRLCANLWGAKLHWSMFLAFSSVSPASHHFIITLGPSITAPCGVQYPRPGSTLSRPRSWSWGLTWHLTDYRARDFSQCYFDSNQLNITVHRACTQELSYQNPRRFPVISSLFPFSRASYESACLLPSPYLLTSNGDLLIPSHSASCNN